MSEDLRYLLWCIGIGLAIGVVIRFILHWRFPSLIRWSKRRANSMRWGFFALAGALFLTLGAIIWIVNDNRPFAVFFACFAFLEFVMAAARLIRPPIKPAS